MATIFTGLLPVVALPLIQHTLRLRTVEVVGASNQDFSSTPSAGGLHATPNQEETQLWTENLLEGEDLAWGHLRSF
ncbi:unnamed protein product [Pleuronectes platessa]|uniref:Uncharacterized protein n=1 Tax=Pleuronectes platessa TaxID=8262 RepID=A0A9N7TY74_PLEPL|nr:unnamed protein product [Pleuronectes platessa]